MKSRQLWRVHTKQSSSRRFRKAVEATRLILGQALNCKGPDRLCVFVTNLPVFLVLLRIAPSLKLFQAVPLHDDNAAVRRRALDLSDLLARSEGLSAEVLRRCSGLWGVFLQIAVEVSHIDLCDIVNGRLRLGVRGLG